VPICKSRDVKVLNSQDKWFEGSPSEELRQYAGSVPVNWHGFATEPRFALEIISS
jgi:hypothetical protein